MEMESEVLEREREEGLGGMEIATAWQRNYVYTTAIEKRSWAAGSPKCVTLSFTNSKILFVVCACALFTTIGLFDCLLFL
jgi:hypothetical protein